MSEVNKCNVCGKFKPWEELVGLAGGGDEIGNFDQWFECVDCMCGNDLRGFATRKIKKISTLQACIKELEEKLSLYEWKDIPQDFLFPTGRYLIEIIDEDGPKVHLMEVEKTFTAISGALSFDMPGKRTRYMALPTPPTKKGVKE